MEYPLFGGAEDGQEFEWISGIKNECCNRTVLIFYISVSYKLQKTISL